MAFREKLEKAMQEKDLTQAKVCALTGKSKASVSQYLAGIQAPPEHIQKEMAISLGLDPDYFKTDEREFIFPKCEKGIPTLTLHDVAKLMHKHTDTIALGLQQGVFPWGYAIRTGENRWAYFINAKAFAKKEMLI